MGGGNLSMILHPTQGGVATLLVASCRGDRDKFRPGELIGSNICLTFFFFLPINYQVKTLKRVIHLVIFILQLLSNFPWYSRISSNAQNPGQPSLHRDSVGFAKINKSYLPLFGNWNEGL